MIQNRSMTRAAKKRLFRAQITNATAALAAQGIVDLENDIRIVGITFLYTVDSNTGTWQAIEVGTAGSTSLYLTASGENSKSIGYTKSQTVASTALLPAGTALIVRRANTTAATNTAVIDVIVHYEIVDRSTTNRP